MIQGSSSHCYPSNPEPEGIHHPTQLYHDLMDPGYSGGEAAAGPETQLRSILCSLTVLKQKAHEVETLVTMFLSQESPQQVQPFASVGTLIQEIVASASSMMFNCQQMNLSSSQAGTNNSNSHSTNDNHMQAEAQNLHQIKFQRPNNNLGVSDFVGFGFGKLNTNQEFIEGDSFYNWCSNDDTTATTCNNYINLTRAESCSRTTTSIKGDKLKAKDRKSQLSEAYDLVEPEAADLLAKYTHYCHVCGKGFKRDANLRMHMRAHGDEYKSSAALSNPLKKELEGNNEMRPPRKYSCPQQGCRWNKNHAKFQPLKSIICVKNHYKRTHCPKMYVCKRCNRKQFSVLSDLRTHEKHCGDRKWLCSCGTTFSRKDKLMGHVTLFVGHTPIIAQLGDTKLDNHGELQIQFEDKC